MQLSIEAIIILVIAMVLLGLGIAFISGFFKTGTSKLTEPFNAIQFGCDPTPNDPIKIIPSDITYPEGTTQQLRLCFYPDRDSATGKKVGIRMTQADCEETVSGTKAPSVLTQKQSVKKGVVAGYNVLLQPDTNTKAGIYLCTIELVEDGVTAPLASKQVTITVT